MRCSHHVWACVLTLVFGRPLVAQGTDTLSPHRVGWPEVAATAAIVAFTALFDPALARAAAHDQSDALVRFSDNVDRFGEVSVIAPVLVGTAAIGLLAKRPELLRLSVRTATAIGTVSAVVQATKFAVGRSTTVPGS